MFVSVDLQLSFTELLRPPCGVLRLFFLIYNIAGGEKKLAAIRAALLGGLFNILITDVKTGEALYNEMTDEWKVQK